MATDISALYISQSFQNLVQRSASGAFYELATATGTVFVPVSASYSISSSQAGSVVSASYAVSASRANSALTSISSSHAVNADSVVSASYAVSSSIANSALTSISSSHAVNSDNAISASHALDSNTSISASHAANADNAISSSYAVTASYASNAGGGGAFPFTGSAEITGSLGVTGSVVVTRNEIGVNSTLTIKDEAQTSYTEGPTLQFEGSNVGIIKSQASTNFRIDADRDLNINVGSGGSGAQFNLTLANKQDGNFIINDQGHSSATYIHENLVKTGSIRFANTTTDAGIAIRMDDNKMALEMYSGSAFVPIIQRASGSKEVKLFDSTASTGSSAQVLSSNSQGGLEWAAAAGASAFPFTGSASITGSLAITGSTVVSKNEVGSNATLIIRDDAQSSYTEGPTLQFEGSNVGLIKSQAGTNFKILADRDLNMRVGDGGSGAQFNFNLANKQDGDFVINDEGHRNARYIHDNITESGSISFSNTSLDIGIAIRIDDTKMSITMRSGSLNIPIIERKVATKEINIYDSTNSTGSSGQVLSSNAQGGIEWVTP